MSMLFSGFWAMAFAVLGGILLAMGVGLLGRWLLGIPAALLAAPLRRLGAPGMLAGTGLAANRWRTAALATPIVLVAMLAGIQGIVESSNQRHTEDVTRPGRRAAHVVVGADGAPLPAGTAAAVARLARRRRRRPRSCRRRSTRSRRARRAGPVAGRRRGRTRRRRRSIPTWSRGSLARRPRRRRRRQPRVRRRRRPAGRRHGSRCGWPTRRARRSRGGGLRPRGRTRRRPARPGRRPAPRGVPADTALFVAGGAGAGRSLARYAAAHPGIGRSTAARTSTRSRDQRRRRVGRLAGGRPRRRVRGARARQHGGDDHDGAPWRARDDPAARRHAGPGDADGHARDAPDRRRGAGAGAAIVAVAVAGVPRGLTGVPLACRSSSRRPWRPAPRSSGCWPPGHDAARAAGLAGGGDAREGVSAGTPERAWRRPRTGAASARCTVAAGGLGPRPGAGSRSPALLVSGDGPGTHRAHQMDAALVVAERSLEESSDDAEATTVCASALARLTDQSSVYAAPSLVRL